MLMLSKSLVNRPIVSLRSGGEIAVAVEPIINPHNLKILGWWCRMPGGQREVLLTDDIREMMPGGIAINDESALSPPEDLVRHQEVLDINFELINKLVKTKRQKLGKVSDYSYNDGLFVQKLYVARPLRKVLTTDDTLLIDRTQIIEVTDHYILVRDVEAKDSAEELATAGAAAPIG
ncbi:MAG TPA: hypothetical protein VFW90_01785 [Candidatus Saccharimonadales bacterium]|nr:hypothetical protein [Candidatus Saccharimonadales bacterium]